MDNAKSFQGELHLRSRTRERNVDAVSPFFHYEVLRDEIFGLLSFGDL